MLATFALLGAGVVGGVVGANIADDGVTTIVSEQPAVVRADETAAEPTSIGVVQLGDDRRRAGRRDPRAEHRQRLGLGR